MVFIVFIGESSLMTDTGYRSLDATLKKMVTVHGFFEITNSKHQITNKSQISNSKFQTDSTRSAGACAA